jgi:hypothetical protein
MKHMREIIEGLEDSRAKTILTKIAETLKRRGYESEWSAEMGPALRDAFQPDVCLQPVSEGDLARYALLVLAEDPVYCELIRALVQGPSPERFGVDASTITLIPAVLLVLQTHIKIKRNAAGKWEFLFEKKPTHAEILKPLISKLLGWIQS